MVENPAIDDAYRLSNRQDGKGPIVITFVSVNEKDRVFEQKSKLKKMKSDETSGVYLNHYLVPQENEKRKRERLIRSKNKQLQSPKDIEKVSGKLVVGSKTYQKQVQPPQPTDLLNYSVEDLDKTLKTQTTRGPEVKNKDSMFIAYAIDTDNFQQVREAYFKIRLLHAKAKHIVCAYNLPCDPSEDFLYKDSCDDGEIGAGAHILAGMKKNNIIHKAFFVVRHCGKIKLNEDRLDSYCQAVKALMTQKPLNSLTQCLQFFKDNAPYLPRKNQTGKAGTTTTTTTRKLYSEAASP